MKQIKPIPSKDHTIEKTPVDLNTKIGPVIYARLFCELLEEEGIHPAEVLAGTGLSPIDLADPKNLMSIGQHVIVYGNIARLTRHPTIGLLQGQQFKLHHHGVFGYAMQTASNLGQAIRIFNQYFEIAGGAAQQSLLISGTEARWISSKVIPEGPGRRVSMEENLSGNYMLCKQLTEGKFKLSELRLDYSAPEGYELYEDIFQCPVLFDQDMIEMRFDSSLLNFRLKYADSATERECEERCQRFLSNLAAADTIVDRVRRVLYESSCDRRDLDSVAAKLCVTVRTLRRHLKLAGTSFRDVQNEVRKALAIDYLSSTDISVDEISYLLGYSEPSNFRHAFKHWTGETPTSYRNYRQGS